MMDGVLAGLITGLIVLLLMVRTIQLCLLHRLWLIPVMLLADALVGWGAQLYGFVLWKMATLGLLVMMVAYRGLFRMPDWPRQAREGRRRRLKRQFREPSPWTRGPFTY